MERKTPEMRAREVLLQYNGYNNQIIDWKNRTLTSKSYRLTRSQADYILKYHEVVPKVARKHISIAPNFGEKLKEEKLLMVAPHKVWCEKLLCESDKAFHIWGKVLDTEQNHAMWLPKSVITPDAKRLEREVDYSPYSHRAPMEHQKVAIEKLLANDKFILADDMGLGKCEHVDNLLFTPTGRKRIGDVVAGDLVIGSNGKATKVVGVFPQGEKDLYRVTFNDGYSVLVGGEHLWTVSSRCSGRNSNNGRQSSVVLSTEQMMNETLTIEVEGKGWNKKRTYKVKTHYKEKNGNLKWQIPIVEPIEYGNEVDLPIEPYLLGVFLGDGNINTVGVKVEVHKDDFEELLSGCDFTECKSTGNKRKAYFSMGNHLVDLGIANTRSHTKFIPDVYKYAPINERLSLLQGLMDTDGHCMKSHNGGFTGTEYATTSKQLANDVAELVQSLGGIVRLKSKIGSYKKPDGAKVVCKVCYRLNIKLPVGLNPFRIQRKSKAYNTPKKYQVGRYIKDIKLESKGEAVCIAVDAPDKLYVTEHCIVTHNTTSAIIASLETKAKKILIVCPASLKINWMREIENYSDRKVLIVEGKKWGSDFDYYIINYDIVKNFHSLSDSDEGKYLLEQNFELAIVDEAHYLANPSAQRTKLLNDILEKIPKVWLLTGTPMTSRPINYFNLLKLANCPVALNWQGYVRRYCAGYQFNVGGKKIWNTSGASNLDELRDRTKSIILRRMKTDILDLPEKIITPVFLELSNTFYDDELEEFMKITKEGKTKESITVTLNRLMKIRQIIATEKVPHTCELIDKFVEQGKKVIVFTNFTSSLDLIHERYKKNSVTLDGRMSKEKRQESVDKFQNNDKIKVFISNIVAGGVGITLTAAETVIMNDLSFVPAHHSQAEDRAYRYGQKNSVLVYYPIFDNTIERNVYNILQKKKNIIDQVMGDVDEYSESFAKDLFKQIF
jgi:hypothetical protein